MRTGKREGSGRRGRGRGVDRYGVRRPLGVSGEALAGVHGAEAPSFYWGFRSVASEGDGWGTGPRAFA